MSQENHTKKWGKKKSSLSVITLCKVVLMCDGPKWSHKVTARNFSRSARLTLIPCPSIRDNRFHLNGLQMSRLVAKSSVKIYLHWMSRCMVLSAICKKKNWFRYQGCSHLSPNSRLFFLSSILIILWCVGEDLGSQEKFWVQCLIGASALGPLDKLFNSSLSFLTLV